MRKHFKYIGQQDTTSCGIACIQMLGHYYGKHFSARALQNSARTTGEGISMLELSRLAEKAGFDTTGCKITLSQIHQEVTLPVILHWTGNHYVVLYRISGKKQKRKYHIADPARGKYAIDQTTFLKSWLGEAAAVPQMPGICLLITPGEETTTFDKPERIGILSRFIKYLTMHRKLFRQVACAMLAGSLIQLIIPFLTQSLVDTGIQTGDITFVNALVIAQGILFFSLAISDFLRAKILLHISTRINFNLVKTFLIKTMKLPVSMFGGAKTGDFLQRVADQSRIESFLTSGGLQILFSGINLIIFSIVLAWYHSTIFIIFLVGSILHLSWVAIFLKQRRHLDTSRFFQLSEHQSSLIEIVSGMRDIRLNGAERNKRWDWEKIQANLFNLSIKSLTVNQTQNMGGKIMLYGQSLIITLLSARLVIDGSITLGMMMAIQFILGQANAPIEAMPSLIREFQDALLSMERIEEIHNMENEVQENKVYLPVPANQNIELQNISFQYDEGGLTYELKDINCIFEAGKTTAIVGKSGSGKTTLINLLLGILKPASGNIRAGTVPLDAMNPDEWRSHIGTVLQDGYLFNGTIAANITLGDDFINHEKLQQSLYIANLMDDLKCFPLGINTKTGNNGSNLSQGQKQRILIARAIYKNPDIIFFDEATNALDANNEASITRKLSEFFNHKTVVVAAHRLSTIKNADNIIVLEGGTILEQGNHNSLISKEGAYHDLIHNQLNSNSL